ncbi:hypothetical protein PIB30_042490 [Stylosanthes scabra]|uniref:Rab-GAP TBC domain-containing protein n=1 Tax=Stylosanthes scabra TaxID=79078 RepID=A0ABU6YFI0_9FABA|nr:hypothetical protein [Stylosanthes scabra]
MWRDPGVPADSFYEVRPECTDVPKSRFRIKAGKTLSERKWRAAFSPEGYLDIGKTLSRIQRGGIHPSIRGEVWEFLLGCYDPRSGIEERDEIRERRRDQYTKWKEVCQQLFPLVGSGRFITAPVITEDGHPIHDPLVLLENNPESGVIVPAPDMLNAKPSCTAERVTDKRIIQWMLTLHQIGLDVLRTDRTLVFYEKKENLSKLWDILAVYAWIDTDVGYCQEHLGGGDYLFAFRMLMVLFRREFSFCDSLYLWEMMWALEYDPNLFWVYEEAEAEKSEEAKLRLKSMRHYGKYEREYMKNGAKDAHPPLPISIFLVASVLKEKSSVLLQQAKGLDDVVKILNDVNGNLDAKKACIAALKLHKKYLKKQAQQKALSKTAS